MYDRGRPPATALMINDATHVSIRTLGIAGIDEITRRCLHQDQRAVGASANARAEQHAHDGSAMR